jgi:ferredoxin--NADP+ reductase
VFANDGGRIVQDGRPVPQMYVAGWIKRGPTGIIGTNRADSVATVAALVEDVKSMPADPVRPGGEALRALLDARGLRWIDFAAWKRVDRREVERGAAVGKPREKFTSIEAMLAESR